MFGLVLLVHSVQLGQEYQMDRVTGKKNVCEAAKFFQNFLTFASAKFCPKLKTKISGH
jgi:hypothetical protein